MRSEAEVVADVIVELLEHGLVRRDQLIGLCRVLGVPVDTVKEAADFRQRLGSNRYPRPLVTPPSGLNPNKGAVTERVQSLRKAHMLDSTAPDNLKNNRPERRYYRPTSIDEHGVVWLFCPRCPSYESDGTVPPENVVGVNPDVPGRWHPEHYFIQKGRTRKRSSYCDDCRKRYQRERRVSAKALDAMSSAGIKLVLGPDSTIVGVACKACGAEFVSGDTVLGEATMFHAACAPPLLLDD